MAKNEFLIDGRSRLVDDLTRLQAKASLTTTQAGQYPAGTTKYYDAGGRTRGDMVAIVYNIASFVSSHKWSIRLQGSKNATFTTLRDLAILEVGHSAHISAEVSVTEGKYIMPFSNELDGTVYRYLRHYLTRGGTNGTIQLEMFLTNLQG